MLFREVPIRLCHAYWWEWNVLCSMGIATLHLSCYRCHSLEILPQLHNVRYPTMLQLAPCHVLVSDLNMHTILIEHNILCSHQWAYRILAETSWNSTEYHLHLISHVCIVCSRIGAVYALKYVHQWLVSVMVERLLHFHSHCSLQGNSIGDDGAVAIAEAMKTMTNLKNLQ